MQLKYGTYTFAANGVTCQTNTQPQHNAAGMVATLVTAMTVTGDLLAPSGSTNPQHDLTVMQLALEAALTIPYQDLILFDDNNVRTATLLTNANTLSGVRLMEGATFDAGRSTGEYAVKRAFSFKMSVEYLYPRRLTPLQSFSESVSYSGGMPIRQMCRAVNKPPIDQIVWPYTEYEATQSGEAVGLISWPFGGPKNMPLLLFPAGMLRAAPEITPSGPDRVGPAGYKNYKVRWVARYASVSPLIAAPTLWT